MRYRIPPRLAHVAPDGPDEDAVVVFLMPLPDGPPLVLRESAALIWIIAAEGEGDVPGAVARVAGRPEHEIVCEVADYLRDLVTRGLLEVDEWPG